MAEPIVNTLGIVGIKNCGTYDSNTNYEKLNVVTYQGSSYCAKGNTVGNLPTNTTYWDLIAQKGDKGDTGDTGPQGPKPVKGIDYYTEEDKEDLEETLTNDVTSEVSNQLNNLTSSTPLVASSITDMIDTTRIYVNSTDGHWYWYNGSSWIDGGVYQATAIANGSVTLNNLNDDVINNRYTSNEKNCFNPFEIQDNKSIVSATGVINDNNEFWLSNKIYLDANEYLRCELSDDYYNTVSKPYTAYKLVAYQNDDTFIETVTNASKYRASQDCYVLLQFRKSNQPLSNRFKICCRRSSTDFTNTLYKNFYPYTVNKKENIYLNIDENDFSNSSKHRLVGLVNITKDCFEIGTIYSGGGHEGNATNRVRSKTILSFPIGTKIISDGNASFRIIFYDENDDHVLNDATEFTQGVYIFTENKRGRIIGAMFPQTDISDVNEWFSHITFIPNINLIIDTLMNNNLISNSSYINYEGNEIKLKNKLYYEKQEFQTLYQDSCQYNDKVFIFNHQGQFKVYDLITETETQLFDLDQYDTIKPHCNAVFFGNQKYSDSDLYPILYVNAYNTSGLPLGTLYAHRIIYDSENDVYSTQLLQTIRIGFTDNEIWTITGDIRPYGNFILNTNTNELYVFTLRGENTRFFKFDMPSIFNGDIILNINDIKDMFDTEYFPYIQGCCYSNNQIFCLNGNDTIISDSSYLRVIDLSVKTCVSNVPLSTLMNEPESIFVYNDSLYIGGPDYFYRFN